MQTEVKGQTRWDWVQGPGLWSVFGKFQAKKWESMCQYLASVTPLGGALMWLQEGGYQVCGVPNPLA